jgi:glycosyltransferase involved in cell wall biosynthesis
MKGTVSGGLNIRPSIENTATRKRPKVSIGMPVFNGECYIGSALSSLLNQTFTDFELIISDNASTDGTEGICKEYASHDPRVRYVRQLKNQGGVANFNFVLREAVGDYFMWAAADDWWSPGWLSELVPLLDDQTVQLAFGETIRTKADLSPDGSTKCYSIKNSVTLIRLLRFFILDENTKGNLFYGLMRTGMINSIGFYIPTYQTNYGWDYLQIFKILTLGKISSAKGVVLKKRNTVVGVRRFKNKIPRLALQYLLTFTTVFGIDRLNYYREFIKLSPTLLGKIIIITLIPVKIFLALLYEYARGAKDGVLIILSEIHRRNN